MEKNKVNLNEEENYDVTVDQENNDDVQQEQKPEKRKYGFGETVVYYGKKGLRKVGRGIKKAAPFMFGIALGAGGALGICTAIGGRNNYNGYNNDNPEEPEIIDGEATVEDAE